MIWKRKRWKRHKNRTIYRLSVTLWIFFWAVYLAHLLRNWSLVPTHLRYQATNFSNIGPIESNVDVDSSKYRFFFTTSAYLKPTYLAPPMWLRVVVWTNLRRIVSLSHSPFPSHSWRKCWSISRIINSHLSVSFLLWIWIKLADFSTSSQGCFPKAPRTFVSIILIFFFILQIQIFALLTSIRHTLDGFFVDSRIFPLFLLFYHSVTVILHKKFPGIPLFLPHSHFTQNVSLPFLTNLALMYNILTLLHVKPTTLSQNPDRVISFHSKSDAKWCQFQRSDMNWLSVAAFGRQFSMFYKLTCHWKLLGHWNPLNPNLKIPKTHAYPRL